MPIHWVGLISYLCFGLPTINIECFRYWVVLFFSEYSLSCYLKLSGIFYFKFAFENIRYINIYWMFYDAVNCINRCTITSMFLDINPIQGHKRSGKYQKLARDAKAGKLIQNVVGFNKNL